MTSAPARTREHRGGPTRTVLTGAGAGLAIGVLFTAGMLADTLPVTALTGYAGSSPLATAAQLVAAVALGGLLGLLLGERVTGSGELVLWGLLYGACWWFLGPLTLLPLARQGSAAWDLSAVQAQLPSLFGLLLYGALTALLYGALRRCLSPGPRWGSLARGLVAGLLSALVLQLVLGDAGGLHLGWLLPAGALAGLCYPLLFGTHKTGAGPGLVQGTTYGFLAWLVAIAVVPVLLGGGGAAWSRAVVTEGAATLPPYLLLGAGIALVFTWLESLGEWLFVDDITKLRSTSPGSWGIRATGYGAAAGLVGGLVFTVVMLAVNEFGQVARIIGMSAPVAGFVVHLVIAQLIGISYAVLFRRRSFDLSSGLGWGVCYGFFWWVFGNMTLLPLLTGEPLRFDAAALDLGFPSLVGHLAYGAALGGIYFQLEERIDPWWFTRSTLEAQQAERRRTELLGTAPALWGLIVVVVLTLPVIIGG
ncbi:MAG TPA: hypothetical protein VH008_33690 [Pseudonocardia sp.]|nr:hypothetical protein [Pseudonocardia sp.]